MTAIKLARSIAILLTIFIVACRSESPSDPVCRIDSEQLDNISANAKCVIRIDDLLLAVVRTGSDQFELPGGRIENEETAQCTAHREIWRLTGFNVEVGNYLGNDRNGTRYYSCDLDAGFNGDITSFPIPEWSQDDIRKIELIDLFDVRDKDWKTPENLPNIRNMFNKIRS